MPDYKLFVVEGFDLDMGHTFYEEKKTLKEAQEWATFLEAEGIPTRLFGVDDNDKCHLIAKKIPK